MGGKCVIGGVGGVLWHGECEGRLFECHVLALQTVKHITQVFVFMLGRFILSLEFRNLVLKLVENILDEILVAVA
jgi:hypothetical protein